MKKIIKCVLVVLILLIVVCNILYTESYTRPKCLLKAQNASISDLIDYHACIYDIDSEPLKKVAYCESRFKPNAINYHDGGKGRHSVGIFQFQKRTFDYWETKLGEDLNYDSAYDQAKLASYMWSKGQAKQWSCSRILKIV